MKNGKLEITDLMIGDWLCCDSDITNKEAYTKVIGIYNNGDVAIEEEGFIGEGGLDLLYPIPITEEILENNFENHNGYFYNCELGEKGNIAHIPNGFILNFVNAVCIINLQMNYIHELQHALRLCGLTELANNFKI